MKKNKPENLLEILASFSNRRIIVLGDIMLDQYIWGKVQRISPEAPVPIIEVQSEEFRLGGAANVALNLCALGARVELVGICGKDSHAKTIKQLLKKQKLSTEGIFGDAERPTTLKTRIGAASQQIVRIDLEQTNELNNALAQELIAYLETLIPQCDALVIEDYDKGLLNAAMIAEVLQLCHKHAVPVAVDPKQKNFFCYQQVEIFKPNFAELQGSLGKSLASEEDFISSAAKLRSEMNAKFLVVTRGSKGMYIFDGSEQPTCLPSFAREVFDVSGAGDTVISALCLAYLFARDIVSAALIANHAAAVVVAKHGTATANPVEIMESFDDLR